MHTCCLTHLRFLCFYDSPHRFLHQQNLQRSRGRKTRWRRGGGEQNKNRREVFRQSERSGTHKQRSIMHTKKQIALCLRAWVLTADSASCFFLAMSVAELFLCSSSSLRSRQTHKEVIGFYSEGSIKWKSVKENPDGIKSQSQNAFLAN